jgi:hypothetical protein
MPSAISNQAAQLVGAWKLISYDLFPVKSDENIPMFKPHGHQPFGRAVFTDSGYMSATLTPGDRAKPFQTQEWHFASDEDIAYVARGMTTYSGAYKLSQEEGSLTLTTKVEIALDPSWIGGLQKRNIELYSNGAREYLVLRPVQFLALPVWTFLYN